MNRDLSATASEPSPGPDSELVERQQRRIAELEELLAELPELRRRLLEVEQRLAELPELRRRSERLAEMEASPAVRLVNGARERGRLRAASWLRRLRAEGKRRLAGIVRRIAGDE